MESVGSAGEARRDRAFFDEMSARLDRTGSNPAAFVAAKNIHRRNLTTNERALIAAKMAGLANGSNRFEKKAREVGVVETTPTVSLYQAAELMGISRDTVACAKTILDHGSETDIAAAAKGAGLRPMADDARRGAAS